jgi:hypothetical protein
VNAATQRELRGLGPKKIARFVSLGLLDELEPGSWEVHEWAKYQPNDPTAAERKRRWRARRAQRLREWLDSWTRCECSNDGHAAAEAAGARPARL